MEKLIDLLENLEDGYSFETYIANLLKLLNYENVVVTSFSGDYGIDVLAEKDNIKYAIQCKYYTEAVGNKSVQEAFAGKSFYNCHVAIVATNNFFTENAKKLANDIGVVLWDKYSIFKLIHNIMEKENDIRLSENANNTVPNNDITVDLLNKIIDFMFETNRVSVTAIQSQFGLGYTKSGRIMDKFEELGVVSTFQRDVPRKMLITKDEWKRIRKTLK